MEIDIDTNEFSNIIQEIGNSILRSLPGTYGYLEIKSRKMLDDKIYYSVDHGYWGDVEIIGDHAILSLDNGILNADFSFVDNFYSGSNKGIIKDGKMADAGVENIIEIFDYGLHNVVKDIQTIFKDGIAVSDIYTLNLREVTAIIETPLITKADNWKFNLKLESSISKKAKGLNVMLVFDVIDEYAPPDAILGREGGRKYKQYKEDFEKRK